MLCTPAIRAHLLRDNELASAVDAALRRTCKCYWSLSSCPKFSVIAPADLLTTMILERPQFGGALQQDVGEALQLLQLGSVPGTEFGEHRSHTCAEGVTLATLHADIFQMDSISLQDPWDSVPLDLDRLSTLPSCLAIADPWFPLLQP